MRRFLLLSACAVAGCEADVIDPGPPPPATLDAQLRASIGNWGIVPIGEMAPQDPAQVALGRALFFDKILSGNRDIACATCHDPAAGLGDGLSLAVGTGGSGSATTRQLGVSRQFTVRNAPSLLNSGLGLFYIFWDLRLSGSHGHFALDSGLVLPSGLPNILSAQALLPVLNRREMRGETGENELAGFADHETAQVWDALMTRLRDIPAYVAMFNAAFPGVARHRFEHAARALAAFQMQEFTRTDSPFDRYLNRDDNALTTEQKRGGLLFFGKALCSTCHNGPLLGAQGLANVGAPQVGPGGSSRPPLDLGRGEHLDFQGYTFAFRVAPLRNVELTAPYFHSGAYQTLESVVRHYNNVPEALRDYDPSQLDPAVRPLYHGDPETVETIIQLLDPRLGRGLDLSDGEISELVAFLKALTDPAARDLRSLVPASVPSGLPVRE